MAIRLRTVDRVRVALCAAETDPRPGDDYLDDADHYALAAKFALDWRGQTVDWKYPEWDAMASQKVRDAREELLRWQGAQPARLDADRTAKPRTEILAVVEPPRDGNCVVFANHVREYVVAPLAPECIACEAEDRTGRIKRGHSCTQAPSVTEDDKR